jgi:hypothetical protein
MKHILIVALDAVGVVLDPAGYQRRAFFGCHDG